MGLGIKEVGKFGVVDAVRTLLVEKAQPTSVIVHTPQTTGTVNTLFSQFLRGGLLVA